jgi:TonB-dependent starch-binding outer membrane protein SusC
MRSKFKWFFMLLLAFSFQFSLAQEKTITGAVTEGGLALPGATVSVKGTKNNTLTDFDGKYSIKAKQGDVLEFSFVGLKTKSVTVSSSNTINVSMESDVTVLGEVVVLGYSSEKKEKVIGAVSVVKAANIESVAFASFDQILQGQAAGVTVSSGSGQPGASSKVRIRGTSSITGGNDPLYLLDGVPITSGDFAALNPNDFENVSVLKDASATSIYGSRASAGVIVITSKKGRFNEETSFTYRSQYGTAEVGSPKFKMMNSAQLLNFQRLVGNGRGVGLTDAEIADLAQVNTDWSDVFFRIGKTTSHELSVRGGGEKTRFFSSINYFEQDGVAERSNIQRFTFRSNLENKVSDRVTLGYNLTLGFTKQDLIDSENGVALQNPYAAAYLGAP